MSAGLTPKVITVITPHVVQPCTVLQLAAAAGVSRRMIFLALKVKRAGCDEMNRMLLSGGLTMNLAVQLVEWFPSHQDQSAVLAELVALPPKQRLRFARHVAALVRDENPRVIDKEPTGSETVPIPPNAGPFNGPKSGGVSVSTAPKTGVFPNQSAIRLSSHADSNCHEGEAS